MQPGQPGLLRPQRLGREEWGADVARRRWRATATPHYGTAGVASRQGMPLPVHVHAPAPRNARRGGGSIRGPARTRALIALGTNPADLPQGHIARFYALGTADSAPLTRQLCCSRNRVAGAEPQQATLAAPPCRDERDEGKGLGGFRPRTARSGTPPMRAASCTSRASSATTSPGKPSRAPRALPPPPPLSRARGGSAWDRDPCRGIALANGVTRLVKLACTERRWYSTIFMLCDWSCQLICECLTQFRRECPRASWLQKWSRDQTA